MATQASGWTCMVRSPSSRLSLEVVESCPGGGAELLGGTHPLLGHDGRHLWDFLVVAASRSPPTHLPFASWHRHRAEGSGCKRCGGPHVHDGLAGGVCRGYTASHVLPKHGPTPEPDAGSPQGHHGVSCGALADHYLHG